jgi:uncharacterized protein with HEPN domain
MRNKTDKDNEVYLLHILDSIKKIDQYIKGYDYDKFVRDTKVQDAVVRQLEIIGEATKSVSKPFRDKFSNVEWKDMAGMRNKLIHNYLDVKLSIVWNTVKEYIPNLKRKIKKILS